MSLVVALLLGLVSAQEIGKQKTEFHPALNLGMCTNSGGCQKEKKSMTMDANWRWTHNTGGYTNCYTDTSWDKSYCPDPKTCAKNCAIDGVDTQDMKNTYGVSSDGDKLRLNFVTHGQYSKNVGSRMYMMKVSGDIPLYI